MIGFDKTAAISFLIGYFIVGTGFFPVQRSGTFDYFVWLIIGLITSILIGFAFGIIKFIKLKPSKDNIDIDKLTQGG